MYSNPLHTFYASLETVARLIAEPDRANPNKGHVRVDCCSTILLLQSDVTRMIDVALSFWSAYARRKLGRVCQH